MKWIEGYLAWGIVLFVGSLLFVVGAFLHLAEELKKPL